MNEDTPITTYFRRLGENDSIAQRTIWAEYFSTLIVYARNRLRQCGSQLVAHDEDVVLSVFNSLFEKTSQGNLLNITDRNELWAMLLEFTHRKVIDKTRYEFAQKRGAGKVKAVSQLAEDSAEFMASLSAPDSSEATLNRFADCIQEIAEKLDENHRSVFLMRLDGKSNKEIAAQIDRSLATVERRLKRIRGHVQQSGISM